MRISGFFSILTLALATTCEATKRYARVSVENASDNHLLSVSLVHKYSDNYKNQRQWAVIHPHSSSPDYLDVEYNTGFGTTGRDWWLLTWYSEDLQTQYYTNPNNFRGVFDALDKVAPSMIEAVIDYAASLIDSDPNSVVGEAVNAAVELAKETTQQLFNTEATEGFKQHILRTEDSNAVTRIIINGEGEGTVTFVSRSGSSSTVYASKRSNI